MNTDALLVLCLLAGIIIILVLLNQVATLRRDLESRAHALHEQWRKRDCDAIRSQEGDVARRAAETELQHWKTIAERGIRRDAVTRSQAVTIGKVSEHIAPYLPDFLYNPKDARFVGSPIDFVVFDGLDDGAVTQVVFVEVKSGSSSLNTRERQIRDAVRAGRVRWEELRVDSPVAS